MSVLLLLTQEDESVLQILGLDESQLVLVQERESAFQLLEPFWCQLRKSLRDEPV